MRTGSTGLKVQTKLASYGFRFRIGLFCDVSWLHVYMTNAFFFCILLKYINPFLLLEKVGFCVLLIFCWSSFTYTNEGPCKCDKNDSELH